MNAAAESSIAENMRRAGTPARIRVASRRFRVTYGRFRLLVLMICAAPTVVGCGDPGSLRIGVLLPLTGPNALGWDQPLLWATDTVNTAGGIAGSDLELVWADLGQEDAVDAARRFAADSSIVAVIGTDTSHTTSKVANILSKAGKVLISPAASSGDLYRQFGPKRFLWRTLESDVAQVQTLLLLASRSGAEKVALLASEESYGNTFFDWFGFFATELGLNVTAVLRATDDTRASVAEVLSGDPDTVFVIMPTVAQNTAVITELRSTSPDTKVWMGDSGYSPLLLSALGNDAEGLEGTAIGSDPASGFDIAWTVQFGSQPPPYAANAYDAVLLAAYGLERSGGNGGEHLISALKDVVDARGRATRWDGTGVAAALAELRAGRLPDVSGATGNLEFDAKWHTDLVSSTYAHWTVDHGRFVVLEHVTTGDGGRSTSLANSLASQRQMQDVQNVGEYRPGPRTGSWALIAALSTGWENYRHQADALAQYQLLKANGISDDRIVLIVENDLATNPNNPEPGVVRNQPEGPNLNHDLQIDYPLHDIDAADLIDILSGRASDRLPVVLGGTTGDDVYVFIVGHGDQDGLMVDGRRDSGHGFSYVVPDDLATAVNAMYGEGRYRQMLISLEACHGGVMGTGLASPGALLFSGANPFESSFATNYDPDLQAWLADEFAFSLVQTASRNADMSLADIYPDLYLTVPGSHLTVYNTANFGNLATTRLKEFVMP